MNIRLAAIGKHLGGELKDYKIYKRGLEQDLKLVKFKASHAEKTKQFHQLVRLIKRLDIKHIILDPLSSSKFLHPINTIFLLISSCIFCNKCSTPC